MRSVTHLSPSFTLDEFIVSQEAARRGIDNMPMAWAIENLKYVANQLENIRGPVLGGRPIIVSSGFRCPKLNDAVGGSPNSAHLKGLAADFIAPKFGTPYDICQAIVRHNIIFDQLIYEQTWVHIGWSEGTQRGQILTYRGGKYLPGIVE